MPSIPFLGLWETVQTLIRRRVLRCLIMVYTVCMQEFPFKLEWKWNKYGNAPKFSDRQVSANSVDPDQIAVWSKSTLLTILSASCGSITKCIKMILLLQYLFWVSIFFIFLRYTKHPQKWHVDLSICKDRQVTLHHYFFKVFAIFGYLKKEMNYEDFKKLVKLLVFSSPEQRSRRLRRR